jgi:hypothetical protein
MWVNSEKILKKNCPNNNQTPLLMNKTKAQLATRRHYNFLDSV